MQKKKVFKIEDSNIEGIGTDLDKNLRASAASTEKAWKRVKQDTPGLYIWRIEKFKVKRNKDAETFGQFFNDDSYIVLNIRKVEDEIKMDVHFWLGTTTSQDEAGTAAYKTVELDDFLGGKPIQHREVSGYESELFLSYFPNNIRIVDGGIESGFNHVSPETYEPRLLWIKGKKCIRCVEVPIELKSLNSGDVFILDAGLDLYQYQGRACGKNEKVHAGRLQRGLDDERRGKPEVYVFSQIEKIDDTMCKFFGYFKNDIDDEDHKVGTAVSEELAKEMRDKISESKGGDDQEWEKDSNKVLYRLSDESGELDFKKEEGSGDTITKDMLDTNDVFIFDVGCKIFVWIGKGASKNEKKQAFRFASRYLKEHDRPCSLPVTSIYEGGENEEFEAFFD